MAIKHHSNENFLDNNKLTFGTSDDLQLYHDGSNSNYITSTTSDIYLRNEGSNDKIYIQATNGSTLANYITIDGSATRTAVHKEMRVDDAVLFSLGASADLKLFHNGTDSYIENDTGDLYIKNNVDDKDIIFQSDDGSGGYASYFRLDGSTVETRFHKATLHLDNVKAKYGDSGDLQIFHDGTNTFIESSTGNFDITQLLNNGDMRFRCDNGAGSEATYFSLDGSAATHDGSATTSLTTNWPDNSKITLGGSNDLQLLHNATNSYIQNYVGDLYINNWADDKDIIFQSDDGSGGVATYFFLDGSQVNTNFQKDVIFADSKKALFGGSGDLQVYHDGSNSYIKNATGDLYIQQNADDKDLVLQCDDGSGGVTAYITLDGSAETILAHKGINLAGSLTFTQSSAAFINHNVTSQSVKFRLSNSSALDVVPLEITPGYISSSVDIYLGANNIGRDTHNIIDFATDNHITFKTDQSTALQIDSNQSVKVVSGSLQISGDNANYVTLTESGSGDFTIDAADDIRLDAGGGDVVLKDDGTEFGRLSNSSTDFVISASTQDKDILFKGDDGGSAITALTLDMSDAGTAIFSHDVKLPDSGQLSLGNSGDLKLYHNATDSVIENEVGHLYIVNDADDKDIIFQSDDGSGGMTTYLTLDGSSSKVLVNRPSIFYDTIEMASYIYHNGDTNTYFGFSGADTFIINTDNSTRVKVTNDGKIGINQTSPNATLEVLGDINDNWAGRFENTDSGGYGILAKIAGTSANERIFEARVGSTAKMLITGDGNTTFAGVVDFNGSETRFNVDGDSSAKFLDVGTNAIGLYAGAGDGLYLGANNAASLYFASGVDATFVGDVAVGGFSDSGTSSLSIRSGGEHDTRLGLFESSENYGFSLNYDGGLNDFIIKRHDNSSGGSAVLTFNRDDDNATFAGDINLADSKVLKLGASSDLQLKHDGTNNYIDGSTGHLYIRNTAQDKDIVIQGNDGGSTVTALEFDMSAGGNATFAGQVNIPDSTELRFGDGDDFAFQHNGTHNLIKSHTGDLKLINYQDDGNISFFSDDGSSGVAEYFRLDGDIGYNRFYKHARFEDNVEARFGTGNDLKIYHNSSNDRGYIYNATGDLYIENDATDGDIKFFSDDGSGGTTEYFRLDGGNEIVLASKGFLYIDNAHADFGNSHDLQIYHDGTDSYVSNTQNSGDLIIQNGANDKDVVFKCDDNSGGLAEYFRLDGSAMETYFSKTILFFDDVVAKFGDGSDLRIQHSSGDSSSYIQNYTGDLNIQNLADDKDIIFKCDDGSGGVTAYLTLDGSQGFTTAQKAIRFDDSVPLQLGNGADLRIYHDGTANHIEAHTGDLYFTNYHDDKDIIFRTDDSSGGVAEYFRLDGSAHTTIFSYNIALNDNVKAQFGGAGDLEIYHDGSNSYIDDGGTGELRIRSSATAMMSANGSEYIAYFAGTGAQGASLYAGNSKKLETVANGVNATYSVTGNTDGTHAGDIVHLGETTTVAGKIYHYKSDGAWELVDADAASTCDGLLAVALGTSSSTNGMLLRGMVTLDHDPGAVGDTLFASTTAGQATATAPSGSGDIVRVIGYCLNASNGQIWFNPDGAFVEVTAG